MLGKPQFVKKAMFVAFKQQRGAGLFEFGIAVLVVGILIFMLLQRMHFYQAEAEQAQVQMVTADIRSSLDAKLALGHLPGHWVNLDELMQQNPLDWLDKKPDNYAGEFFAPTTQDIAPGNWYFDRHDKNLVYLLNNQKTFGDAVQKRLRFKVKLIRLPSTLAKPSGTPDNGGVTFDQVTE